MNHCDLQACLSTTSSSSPFSSSLSITDNSDEDSTSVNTYYSFLHSRLLFCCCVSVSLVICHTSRVICHASRVVSRFKNQSDLSHDPWSCYHVSASPPKIKLINFKLRDHCRHCDRQWLYILFIFDRNFTVTTKCRYPLSSRRGKYI